jgi:hypothetical protein
MPKNRWITITDDDGTTRRYNLASMEALGISARQDSWGTGVALEEVYLMPRSKRLILQTYSVWAERPGSPYNEGRRYHVADPETVAELYRRFGDERLLPLIPEGEA